MARTFVRNTSYLSLASAPITAAPCTLVCWGRSTDTTNSQYAISIGHPTVSATGFFGLQFAGHVATDPIRAIAGGSAGFGVAAASGFTSGTWYHAAAVFTSASSRTAYNNGTAGTPETTTASPSGITESYIALDAGLKTAGFAGDLADVAIYNVALTAAEIASLAAGASPLTIRPDALVAYWPLFNSDGDVDWWGQNNMTPTGSPTYAQHPPLIYPGSPKLIIPQPYDPSPFARALLATEETYGGGIAWTNPERTVTQDGSSATNYIESPQSTNWLQVVANFFLPPTATIVGIQGIVRAQCSNPFGDVTIADYDILINGTPATTTATIDNAALTNSMQTRVVGGATELHGETWDVTDSIGFRMRIATISSGDSIDVDYLAVKVWYTDASGQTVEVETGLIQVTGIAPTTLKATTAPIALADLLGINPATSKSTTVPIALAELLAPAPTTRITAAVPTGLTELASLSPTTAKQSPVPAALVKVTAPTTTTLIVASVPTALVEVLPVTPDTTKAAPVPVGLIEVAAPQPTTATTTPIDTGLIDVLGIAPTTAMTTSVGVGLVIVAAFSLDGSQSVAVPVGSIEVSGVAPGSSKVASVGVGLVEVNSVEPATSKVASVAVGLVEVLGVAAGTLMTASVEVGLVEVIGVAVNTSMAVSVPVGLVVVSGVDLVFVVEVAGELLFTTYVTPSIRSLAALSTSVNAGAQLKPSIEGRVT